MGTIADKLNKLISTKSKIKSAIVSKGQSVSDSDTFDSYASKILAIQTGIDTSDATATADDILLNKTAYAKGNKITGNISYTDMYIGVASSIVEDTSNSSFYKAFWTLSNKLLFEKNSEIGTRIPKSQFGDAYPSEVVKGKTFTSNNGLKAVGTLVTPQWNFVSAYIVNNSSVNIRFNCLSPNSSYLYTTENPYCYTIEIGSQGSATVAIVYAINSELVFFSTDSTTSVNYINVTSSISNFLSPIMSGRLISRYIITESMINSHPTDVTLTISNGR